MRRLDRGVDRAGGVVEHQQPGPADDGAGQREPLPLAAGQRGAALADQGVEPVGQRGDEAVGLRPRRSAAQTSLVGDVGAERDVAAHGVVEEERALGDERGLRR